MLKPEGEHHFLYLTLQCAVGREEQVLGELLCERRAALYSAARGHIGHNRTRETNRVNAEM